MKVYLGQTGTHEQVRVFAVALLVSHQRMTHFFSCRYDLAPLFTVMGAESARKVEPRQLIGQKRYPPIGLATCGTHKLTPANFSKVNLWVARRHTSSLLATPYPHTSRHDSSSSRPFTCFRGGLAGRPHFSSSVCGASCACPSRCHFDCRLKPSCSTGNHVQGTQRPNADHHHRLYQLRLGR